MASRRIRVRAAGGGAAAAQLRAGIEGLQREMDVTPDFPPEVDAAAEKAARTPRLPDLDRTDLPFVTIDPASAMDLDQALHLEREGDGYVVHYAIADLAAFVTPGDPVDLEAHRRGETLYGADSKVPLHPRAISEAAGSLLPDQVRPAMLWTLRLDADGELVETGLERALVRSRAKLAYDDLQARVEAGTADDLTMLLREVGELRIAREAERGGVSLPLPEQEVDIDGDHWGLAFRTQVGVELWNAQISLLTGMAAASLMTEAKVGILRTLPPSDPRDLARLRRTAKALGIAWPDGQEHHELVRSLDATRPEVAAFVVASTSLLRGAGYVGFDGTLPAQTRHEGIAAEYAHVTAPLRRLVDRYGLEACLAIAAGEPVPDWVRERLGELPGTMQRSGQRARQYENAVVDLVESVALAPHVGQEFDAVVVDVDEKDPGRGDITIQDPAIEARVSGNGALPLGERLRVRLAVAEPAERRIEFHVV